jgi:two-component system phosphate regulon response regulator PhoB
MGALVAQPGRPVSREALIEVGWEAGDRPTVRTVDVHIGHLRRKLGEEGRFAIATVEGEGYLWRWPLIVPEPRDTQTHSPVDPSL